MMLIEKADSELVALILVDSEVLEERSLILAILEICLVECLVVDSDEEEPEDLPSEKILRNISKLLLKRPIWELKRRLRIPEN